MDEEDPFVEDEDQLCVRQGYIYRLWRLSKSLVICIRCAVHSHIGATKEFLNVFALTHWNEKRQAWDQ